MEAVKVGGEEAVKVRWREAVEVGGEGRRGEVGRGCKMEGRGRDGGRREEGGGGRCKHPRKQAENQQNNLIASEPSVKSSSSQLMGKQARRSVGKSEALQLVNSGVSHEDGGMGWGAAGGR